MQERSAKWTNGLEVGLVITNTQSQSKKKKYQKNAHKITKIKSKGTTFKIARGPRCTMIANYIVNHSSPYALLTMVQFIYI